jgi:hypothetical protein
LISYPDISSLSIEKYSSIVAFEMVSICKWLPAFQRKFPPLKMEAASTSEISVTVHQRAQVTCQKSQSINTAVRTLYLAEYPYFLITNKIAL